MGKKKDRFKSDAKEATPALETQSPGICSLMIDKSRRADCENALSIVLRTVEGYESFVDTIADLTEVKKSRKITKRLLACYFNIRHEILSVITKEECRPLMWRLSQAGRAVEDARSILRGILEFALGHKEVQALMEARNPIDIIQSWAGVEGRDPTLTDILAGVLRQDYHLLPPNYDDLMRAHYALDEAGGSSHTEGHPSRP